MCSWIEHRTLKEVAETETLRARAQNGGAFPRKPMKIEDWARLAELTLRERKANGKPVVKPGNAA